MIIMYKLHILILSFPPLGSLEVRLSICCLSLYDSPMQEASQRRITRFLMLVKTTNVHEE